MQPPSKPLPIAFHGDRQPIYLEYGRQLLQGISASDDSSMKESFLRVKIHQTESTIENIGIFHKAGWSEMVATSSECTFHWPIDLKPKVLKHRFWVVFDILFLSFSNIRLFQKWRYPFKQMVYHGKSLWKDGVFDGTPIFLGRLYTSSSATVGMTKFCH